MEKMNRDEGNFKKSNAVLGREEGFGSVSLARGSNFEEGSSSSHSHVNNLQEQHRLMMPHTEPSSSSNTKKAPVYPPGSRFLPTDLGLVRVHLRNKVEKNRSGFITTLDLYKDDPWLLDHVQNDLYPRGEWYYFTHRTKRGSKLFKRSVGGRGGGTWKSTTGKEPIMDKDNKVQGYMQSLVYNKTNVNGDIKPTGWIMTEYCLHKENQDDLVLCHIKGNIKKIGFAEEVKNNILPNQVQDHEEGEAGANGVEMRTLEEDHGDATQQQQQEEQDAPVHYINEGQRLEVETMMKTQHNNNFMTMLQEDNGDASQQQQQPQEKDTPVPFIPPRDSRFEMTRNMHNNFMLLQEDHQEQDAMALALPPHEGQGLGFETMVTTPNNNNNFMPMLLQEDHGDPSQQQQQQQQQEQAALALVFPPHEGQYLGFETTMTTQNNENNFMRMVQEDHGNATQQQQEQDAPVHYISEGQRDHGHPSQQQQQDQQDALALALPPHEGQGLGFETMVTTPNNSNIFMPKLLQEDHGDVTQKQQEQDAPVPALPPPEGQDPWFETMMATLEEDLKHHWDDPDFCFIVDELLEGIKEDDVNEGHLQPPVSQAGDAVRESAV